MTDELPQGWAETTLETAGTWRSGGTPSRRRPEFFGKGIPWVKSGDLPDGPILRTEEEITKLGLQNSSAKLMPPGTVSMALYGATIGKLGVMTFHAATNQACANVLPDKRLLEPGYLFYYLLSERRNFIDQGQGGAQPNISQEIVRAHPFRLAPLAEQQRIVAKLEILLGQLNSCQERLAKIPALLNRFRQSVLSAACSGRLTADWREEKQTDESGEQLLQRILEGRRRWWEQDQLKTFQKARRKPRDDRWKIKYVEPKAANTDELEELPIGWVWGTWNQVSNWVTYGFTRPMPHVASGVPIVTAKHVLRRKIELNDTDKTTRTAFEELSAKDCPQTGDLLITKDGSMGRVALVDTDRPFCINQSVAVVWLRSLTLDRRFLLIAAEWPHTQQCISERARGAAIQHLSITDFAKLPLPIPPLAEQEEITSRVEKLFALADGLETRFAEGQKRVDGITQSLLAKAFRGELVPTEFELAKAEGRSFESAEDLLERIKANHKSKPDEKRRAGLGNKRRVAVS